MLAVALLKPEPMPEESRSGAMAATNAMVVIRIHDAEEHEQAQASGTLAHRNPSSRAARVERSGASVGPAQEAGRDGRHGRSRRHFARVHHVFEVPEIRIFAVGTEEKSSR